VDYKVVQSANDFTFDSELDFSSAKFRFQEAEVIFYIPFGETFRMEEELGEILINTLHLNGYRSYQMEGNDWVFDRSGIRCLTCDDVSSRRPRASDSRSRRSSGFRDWEDVRGESMTYEFEEFSKITVTSHLYIKIEQDDEYRVEVKGDDIDDVYLKQRGGRLNIELKNDWDWWDQRDWGKPTKYVYITAPDIEEIELIGACDGQLVGFRGRELEISLTGASELDADIEPRYLDVRLTGASKIKLEGSAERLDVTLIGASRMDALDFKVSRAQVKAIGASKATIYATDEIEIDASGVSSVRYKGTSNVDINSDGLSTVKRY